MGTNRKYPMFRFISSNKFGFHLSFYVGYLENVFQWEETNETTPMLDKDLEMQYQSNGLACY